jgi:tetratricopeptide (TPR) repeat protein
MLRMQRHLLLAFAIAIAIPAIAQTVADNSKPASPAAAAPSTGADTSSVAEPLASAHALLKDRKFTEAAAAFRAILSKNPASVEAHAGLIRSLLRGRKLEEARSAATAALTAVPNSAVVHAAVGDVAFREGKFSESETEYRNAMKLDANCARAQFGMARMYEMVSLNKRARDTYIKAHQLDPSDPQITDKWLQSLSYAEALKEKKKLAGDHPDKQDANMLALLDAFASKKTWELASEIKPVEINMPPYGKSQAYAFTGHSEGVANIHAGFGLNVKFNDRASATLLLDTGAGGIVIGRKLAEKAGAVKIADSKMGGIGDQGLVESYIAWVDKISIGSIEFRNCIVEVSSKSDIVDEAGLIGADVFSKFLITLDFREQKMLLAPLPKNPNPTDDERFQDRYIAPEMQGFTKFYAFGHDIVVPVVVNDKAVGNFILDTGAALNSLNSWFAEQVTKASADDEYRMKGVSGNAERVLTGQKAILQFAKMRIESHDLPVFSSDTISPSEGTQIAGLIGIRALVQMKMTIDYRDGLINFQVYDFQKARE